LLRLYERLRMNTVNNNIYSIFLGTGCYIPTRRVTNADFLGKEFYGSNGVLFPASNQEIIEKFEKITGIKERRYVSDDLVTSDIAFMAAQEAITSAGIDKESLDYIIVAHNFGDVKATNKCSDLVPSIAARVKHRLKIANAAVCYDICFGCPGWLQAVIQADFFLKVGIAKRALVIGAETLSRVSDPHDRDSMIYADGAGAVIMEAVASEKPIGIISHSSRSDTLDQAYLLRMEKSYNPNYKGNELFLKMDGRKLYEYALQVVPAAIKENMDKAGFSVDEITKVLIHQANAKMDEAILKRFFHLYGKNEIPSYIMPMIIYRLGNSSVATLPTLLNLLFTKQVDDQQPSATPKSGDIFVFASVGAGMNVNSVIYRLP
jgi:3-oxoacyl-[acyl-carrier-protein] synthase-3